jgi:hypothetical protein
MMQHLLLFFVVVGIKSVGWSLMKRKGLLWRKHFRPNIKTKDITDNGTKICAVLS